MNRFVSSLLSLAFIFAVGTAQAADYPKMTIRIATSNTDTSRHAVMIDRFEEILAEESNGQITLQKFYGGSMGDEQANVKQLRTGEIHMATLATGNLTPFAAKANALSLPYLLPSFEAAYKLLSNEEFLTEMADEIAAQSRTRPVAWLVGGYRVLTNSKKPVKSLEDLQGLKIRVPAVEMQLDAFRSWGVEPHPLAWSETFNALQQGVVDGQENPHSGSRDMKFWEVQKYITDLHYTLWTGPVLVSEIWFQKLDKATQELIKKAALEATHYEWEWSEKDEDIALATCIENGMIFDQLVDEEEWQKRAEGTWVKYYDLIGGEEFVQKMKDIINN